MTSTDVARELLEQLSRFSCGSPANGSTEYAFALDFESALAFPDLPFDPTQPAARYAEESRPGILHILDTAAATVGGAAPEALAFVNQQLQSVLIRQSTEVSGANSSSNREMVGFCVLTNLHIPADREFVCIEALVHEAIHQYLYRTELQSGNLCDLSDAKTFRSPWSGNRIPLHSLIHAAFVWYGLLRVWHQLARSVTDPQHASLIRDRAAHILFGYTFIGQIMHGPAFPLHSVQPRIVELIDHIARITSAEWAVVGQDHSLRDALASSEDGAWISRLAASLERVDATWQ